MVGSKPLFMLERPPACLNLNASKQSVSTDFEDIINAKGLLLHDCEHVLHFVLFEANKP